MDIILPAPYDQHSYPATPQQSTFFYPAKASSRGYEPSSNDVNGEADEAVQKSERSVGGRVVGIVVRSLLDNGAEVDAHTLRLLLEKRAYERICDEFMED
jgi:hypothetical protein